MKFRKKTASKATKRALGKRGGFAPASFTRTKPYTFSRQLNGIEKTLAKSTPGKALAGLKKLQGTASVRIGKTELSLTRGPSSGLPNSPKTKVGVEESTTVTKVTGNNGLYTSHRHLWNVKVGPEPGPWLRQIEKTGGKTTANEFSTVETYDMDNPIRSELTQQMGFNRKLQWFINPAMFGWSFSNLQDHLADSVYNSPVISEQAAYISIQSLRSVAKISNMNKYIPQIIKVSLVDIKQPYNPIDVMGGAVNPTLTTQVEGCMPLNNQLTVLGSDTIGQTITVDPRSTGVKAANVFKSMCRIVKSKTFKLAAGDYLEVDYEHRSGNGFRLDRLYGLEEEPVINMQFLPITYCLLVEVNGMPVELVKILDKSQIMKGTSICKTQLEFNKSITGYTINTSVDKLVNPSSHFGFLKDVYATKAYTKTVTATQGTRIFNTGYNDVAGSSPLYDIPIMSDATSVDAGSNT